MIHPDSLYVYYQPTERHMLTDMWRISEVNYAATRIFRNRGPHRNVISTVREYIEPCRLASVYEARYANYNAISVLYKSTISGCNGGARQREHLSCLFVGVLLDLITHEGTYRVIVSYLYCKNFPENLYPLWMRLRGSITMNFGWRSVSHGGARLYLPWRHAFRVSFQQNQKKGVRKV